MISSKRLEIIRTYLSSKPEADAFWFTSILVAILFLCSYFFWGLTPEQSAKIVARPDLVFAQKQILPLVTSIFIHADFKHFIANTSIFAVLCFLIYGYYGWPQVFILVVPIGILVNLITILSHSPEVGLLGISGVVYSMAAFWLSLYLAIDRRRSFLRRLLRGIGFTLMILIPTTFEAQVSYTSHFWGFLFGTIWGVTYFLKNQKWLRSFEEFKQENPEPEDPYFYQ